MVAALRRGAGFGPVSSAGAGRRRDYSHLPRFEVFWDFPGGGYCCPECGEPFTLLGDHVSGEQLDWQVIVRLVAHCRRRYKRECDCPVPATVMAPGPPKAIGKGLFSNGFIAMLLTERFVAGRSQNSLVKGLARQGAEISPATLAGSCAQAGALCREPEACGPGPAGQGQRRSLYRRVASLADTDSVCVAQPAPDRHRRPVAVRDRALVGDEHGVVRGGDVDVGTEFRPDNGHQLLQQPRSARHLPGGGHSCTSRPVNQPAASSV